MHRTTLGDFELTVVSDGTYFLDGGAFFGVVPKTMWSKKVTPDEQNRLDTGLNSLLVRTGEKNILIETGIGNKLPEKLVQIYKQPAKLLDNLHAAGVAPEDIDIVINTHLHFDHCGWNTVRRGDQVVATFPNAKYYVQQKEWEHGRLQLERDAISYMSPKLRSADRDRPDGVAERRSGNCARHLGQNLPRAHREYASGDDRESAGQRKKACYISDLIATAAHLDLTWVMAFDLFPLETIESRKKYYAQAIPERWLTVFTHDDAMPWGYVERGERGRLALKKPTLV